MARLDGQGRAALVLIDEDYEPPYLECTFCNMAFDPSEQNVLYWNHCPNCGKVLAYVDDVARLYDGQEYLARVVREPARTLKLTEYRIGG